MNTAINIEQSNLTQQDLVNSLNLAHELNKKHDLYQFMETLIQERRELEKDDRTV